jgi:hypothetical protein
MSSSNQFANFGASYNSLQMKFKLPDGRIAIRRWSDVSRSEYLVDPENDLPLFNDEGNPVDTAWLTAVIEEYAIVKDYEEFLHYQVQMAESALPPKYAKQIIAELQGWENALYGQVGISEQKPKVNPKVETYWARMEDAYAHRVIDPATSPEVQRLQHELQMKEVGERMREDSIRLQVYALKNGKMSLLKTIFRSVRLAISSWLLQ